MKGRRSKVSVILAALLLVTMILNNTSVQAEDQPTGKTYYVDAEQGNDANNGFTIDLAWKTLDKVNSVTFNPGDKILFKAGGAWSGSFKPHGSGSSENPIIVDQYGTGNKPRLAAGGAYEAPVVLENIEYWEVNNLELTNLGPTMEQSRFGLVVRVKDYGTMHHIYIRNLFVHDVNGWLPKLNAKEGAGIYFEARGTVESKFDDLRIENNVLRNVDRNGIAQYYDFGYHKWNVSDSEPTKQSYRSTNVIIRGNVLEDIGGDGIKIWGSDGSLIEHNVVRGAQMRSKDASAGIWPFDSNNTLVQYNEVSGVHGTIDGQAFDADFFTTNTIFQYNYSHDNDGGFMLLCSPGIAYSDGTVVRYNISQNDGSPGSSIFNFGGKATNSYIYNNTIYVSADKAGYPVFRSGSWENGSPSNAKFMNNIFYIEGSLTGYGKLGENFTFDHNAFYGNSFADQPLDSNPITGDPGLIMPGGADFGMSSAAAYGLKPDSVGVNAGATVDDADLGTKLLGTPGLFLDQPFVNANPGKDFFGRTVDTPDLGAIEFAAGTEQATVRSEVPKIDSLAQVAPGTVELKFSGTAHAASYIVEYGPVYGYGYEAKKIRGVSGSTILIPGLDEKDYFFRIAAYTDNVESFYSPESRLSVSNTYVREDFEMGTAAGWSAAQGDWNVAASQGGKVVLEDHFDNGAANWTPTVEWSEADAGWLGQWSIEEHGGNNTYDVSMLGAESVTGSASWQDYSVDVDITPIAYDQWGTATLLLREADASTKYMVLVTESSVIVKKELAGVQSQLAIAPLSTAAGTTRHIKAVVVGDQLDVYADGDKLLTVKDSSIGAGKVGLSSWNANASFDNVRIVLAREALLEDHFDNGAVNWTPTVEWTEADADWLGQWSIVDNGGNKSYNVSVLGAESVTGDVSWQNYSVEADVTPLVYDQWGTATLLLRTADARNKYLLLVTETGILLKKEVNGAQSQLASSPIPTTAGTTRHIKAVVIGDQIEVYADGSKLFNVKDDSISAGKVGLSSWNANASFDNVIITGIYQKDFNQFFEQSNTAGGLTIIGESSWKDYSLEAVSKPTKWSENGSIGLNVRLVDANNYYYIAATSSKLAIQKVADGVTTTLTEKPYAFELNGDYNFKVTAKGDRLEVSVNGQHELSANDGAFAAGKLALNMVNATGQYDDIVAVGLSNASQIGEPIAAREAAGDSDEEEEQPQSPNGSTGGISITDTSSEHQTETPNGVPVVPTIANAFRNAPVAVGVVHVDATNDAEGNAAAVISQKQWSEAVEQASAEAAKQGEGTAPFIEISVNAKADAKTVQVKLPADPQAWALVHGVSVMTPLAAVTFDRASLAAIVDGSSENFALTISQLDHSNVDASTQDTVGDRPIFSFTVTSGGNVFSQFQGNAWVTLPYVKAASEDSNAIIVYYINEQGQLETVTHSIYDEASQTITFRTTHFSAYAVGYKEVGFNDVPALAWYKDAVSFIAARGITTGTSAHEFSPAANMTRAEFVTMLSRAFGIKPLDELADNFADAGHAYYTGYLAAVKKLHIVTGVGDNQFGPNQAITRQEMFTMLHRALLSLGELPQKKITQEAMAFSDAGEVAPWAEQAISELVELGLIHGDGQNLLPTQLTSRAQIAQVLSNVLKKL